MMTAGSPGTRRMMVNTAIDMNARTTTVWRSRRITYSRTPAASVSAAVAGGQVFLPAGSGRRNRPLHDLEVDPIAAALGRDRHLHRLVRSPLDFDRLHLDQRHVSQEAGLDDLLVNRL